jgi:hypothetical protein
LGNYRDSDEIASPARSGLAMTTVLSDLKPALENLFDNSALYFSLVVSMSHAGTLTKSFILSKKILALAINALGQSKSEAMNVFKSGKSPPQRN